MYKMDSFNALHSAHIVCVLCSAHLTPEEAILTAHSLHQFISQYINCIVFLYTVSFLLYSATLLSSSLYSYKLHPIKDTIWSFVCSFCVCVSIRYRGDTLDSETVWTRHFWVVLEQILVCLYFLLNFCNFPWIGNTKTQTNKKSLLMVFWVFQHFWYWKPAYFE